MRKSAVITMSIRDVFLEIDRERFKLAILSSIVNVVLLFLVLNYVFGIFNIPVTINLIINAILFYLSMHIYMKKFDVQSLKRRDPKTEEMLKTARDNIKEDNVVISEFFRQVTDKVKDLSLSDLLNLRGLTIKLVFIIIIAIFSILMPPAVIAQQLNFSTLFVPISTGISFDDKNDVLDNPEAIDLRENIQINI